jgi:hypothetical protein
MMFYPSRFSSPTELSACELFDISNKISKLYSPIVSLKSFGVDKKVPLNPQALLEISEEIARKYAPKKTFSTPKFVLLPIDTEHLYVSWNLHRSQIASASKGQAEEMVLRVFPKTDGKLKPYAENEWFDITLDPAKTQQRVTIPKQHQVGTFSAAIGMRDQYNHLILLTKTNVVHNPRGNMSSHIAGDNINVSSGSSQVFAVIQEKLPVKNFSL